jgi:hypothetical protein
MWRLFGRIRVGTCVLGAVLLLGGPAARGFATGNPLSLTIDPATVRQKSEKTTSTTLATVLLKEPSPAFFVCVIRSDSEAKITFPTIIFRKGDVKGTSEGQVEWKAILHVSRVRISAYNADAPDRKLTYTVTLIPEEEFAPVQPAP